MCAIATTIDAHLAVTNRGFVAVDFHDGAVIYDFDRRRVHPGDLDANLPGPYTLGPDRQYGSTRFMAAEEFRRALIDERTSAFTLAARVRLSERWLMGGARAASRARERSDV